MKPQEDEDEDDLKITFGVEDDWENLELDQLSLVRRTPPSLFFFVLGGALFLRPRTPRASDGNPAPCSFPRVARSS